MKLDRLRQSLAYLLIGLVVFACVNISWADGVEVEVPYAVTSAPWWTGVAIKNLDESSATDPIRIEFFDKEGVFMGTVDIGSLEPLEIYSQTASAIYSGSLPLNYSIKVSQSGSEELIVTVFVGNSATGGFAYQSYGSQVCCQTTAEVPSWHQTLPTAERFELVMNDEAVLDRETGLVWERNTGDTTFGWLSTHGECYNMTIGGRKGWRMPTIEELATLVDPTQSDPSLPPGHPFTNAKSSGYWSSTLFAASISSAWSVYFKSGIVYRQDVGNARYVRAVRSGQ
jgi:hypothetical protein